MHMRQQSLESYYSLFTADGFCLRLAMSWRTEAAGFSCGSETKGKICFRQVGSDGVMGVGWHTFRHTGRNRACGNGGASTHHPGLLAPQQSVGDEQIPAGGIEDKTECASETGGGKSCQ
jgi:hypothetical protein